MESSSLPLVSLSHLPLPFSSLPLPITALALTARPMPLALSCSGTGLWLSALDVDTGFREWSAPNVIPPLRDDRIREDGIGRPLGEFEDRFSEPVWLAIRLRRRENGAGAVVALSGVSSEETFLREDGSRARGSVDVEAVVSGHSNASKLNVEEEGPACITEL